MDALQPIQASQERRATQSRPEAFLLPSLAQIPVAEQDRLQDLWKEEEAGILCAPRPKALQTVNLEENI